MTVKVSITNQDIRESAVIEVIAMDPGSGFQNNLGGVKQQLKAGERAEFWVHPFQTLEIRDISK